MPGPFVVRYKVNIFIDYKMRPRYTASASLIEGRLRRRFPEAERGVASRGLRRNRTSGGAGTAPARLGARPRSPNRHGGAPRGERPFERKGTLGASQAPACRAPRHVICRQRLSALHPPLVGWAVLKTPGAGAPRERTMLFDIVRRMSVARSMERQRNAGRPRRKAPPTRISLRSIRTTLEQQRGGKR
jgi:hypothetical protein